MMTQLRLKRAYEPQQSDDGFRVYIDRLWPQGLSHATFHYDLWEKEIAPSKELREWFHENRDGNWAVFRKKYEEELKSNPSWKEFVGQLEEKPVVTLLFSSRNTTENNAVIVFDTLLTQYPELFTK